MSLIDRIASGLNRLADRTNQAFDEGRVRMEQARVRKRKDVSARDLGYLVYNEHSKGAKPTEGEVAFHVRRIADAEAELAKLEQQLTAMREARGKQAASPDATGDGGAVESAPPPSDG